MHAECTMYNTGLCFQCGAATIDRGDAYEEYGELRAHEDEDDILNTGCVSVLSTSDGTTQPLEGTCELRSSAGTELSGRLPYEESDVMGRRRLVNEVQGALAIFAVLDVLVLFCLYSGMLLDENAHKMDKLFYPHPHYLVIRHAWRLNR